MRNVFLVTLCSAQLLASIGNLFFFFFSFSFSFIIDFLLGEVLVVVNEERAQGKEDIC